MSKRYSLVVFSLAVAAAMPCASADQVPAAAASTEASPIDSRVQEAAPLLLERMKSDKQASVRRSAILGLEPLIEKDATLGPPIIEMLDDRSPEVRIAALDVVSRIHQPEARNAVLARVKREGNPDVRKVLKDAVDRINAANAEAPAQKS